MADDPTLREVSDRLDAVLRQLEDVAEPAVRARAREAVQLLMAIQSAALERVLTLAGDPALGGLPLVARIADDAILGPLLTVHDLHPHPPEVRVRRALERLRARIAASGCRLSGVVLEDGAARVRLAGWSRLRAQSAAELGQWLEPAILEFAPELSSVHLEEDEQADCEPVPLIQITRASSR